MKSIDQILLQKIMCLPATFLIALILFLGVGRELLHNHKPDIKEHENCPVVLVNQILSSGITVHFNFSTEHFVELSYDKPQNLSLFELELFQVYLRAPPIS